MFNFIRKILNILRWLPLLWQDADWDHSYLLKLMAFKMRCMAQYHRTKGITVDANKTARQLEIAALLCDRLNDGPPNYETRHHPVLSRDKASHLLVVEHDAIVLEYLTAYMRKHLRGWWD